MINLLCQSIEQSLGHRVQSPKDFDQLREHIYTRLHHLVSSSTLKRVWGYTSSQSEPSRGTLATWIYTIAYRKAVSFVRQQRPVILSLDDTDTAVPSISDEERSVVADELSTGREERIQALEQALELLPAHDRLLITLYYYQDCSLAEIASIIGATANAVSHRLRRIREKLYTLLTINA
jgi:RNA polymerase sigma-70 factor (ECF subfamily)